MKKIINKNILTLLTLLTVGLFFVSCDEEEYTGDSVTVPVATSITITTDITNHNLIEDNSTYGISVALSQAQVADVVLKVKQIAGDAVLHDDYEMDGSITIAAGATTGAGEITILADDLIEDTETVKIQIGDDATANADFTPAFMEFTIMNYKAGDLAIDLSWDMTEATTDTSGNVISPTSFADLRLLLTDVPYTTVLGGADGGSFETYVLESGDPDGEYYVVADFYDANADIIRDINVHSNFNQAGVITDMSYSFDSALSNATFCPEYYFVLNKITKSGTTYTIEEVGAESEFPATAWPGGTDVIDAFEPAGYASYIVTTSDCSGLIISGLNHDWMEIAWGETIEEEGVVYYTVDGAGVITIESQYIFTTLYDGAYYDYTVSGTGVLDEVNGTLLVQYYLDQDGFSPSNWMFDNGYMATEYFEANVTL